LSIEATELGPTDLFATLSHTLSPSDFTGNADMPYDFFLSRYNKAYVTETIAFCESLVNDTPVPCTGEDGLVAPIMAMAADKSANENRSVPFSSQLLLDNFSNYKP
jgi:hypothetical protein